MNKKAIIIFLLFIIASFGLFVGEVKAFTYYYVSGPSGDWNVNSITVNNPQGIYTPGQQFYIQGTAYTNTCDNSGWRVSAYYGGVSSINLQSISDTRYVPSWVSLNSVSGGCGTCSGWHSTNLNFAAGPYIAPMTPGTYYVYIKADIYQGIAYLPRTWALTSQILGYQPITVACPFMLATCSASPSSAQVNQSITWIATQSGGTTPYTYLWSGDASGTNPTYTTSYPTTGQRSATVKVTDTYGCSATSSACTAEITPPPLTAKCKALPSVPQRYQSVTWSAYDIQGGEAPYTYEWREACEGNNATCTVAGGYLYVGPQTARLVITDKNGLKSPEITCTAQVNAPPPCPTP